MSSAHWARMAAFFSVLLPCGTRRDDARDAGLAALQLVHVDEAAADLEGTNERMILVLHPDLGAGALRKQRPEDLRRRRHNGTDEVGRCLDCGEVRQSHCRGRDRLWHAYVLHHDKAFFQSNTPNPDQW